MGFQQQVYINQGFGVPGSVWDNVQVQSLSYTLNSTDPTTNVFGRAFTLQAEGYAQAGGTGIFLGFMINPKENALLGTPGNPLGASLTLPNYVNATIASKGVFVVYLPDVANVGDQICFSQTDGSLVTVAPGNPAPMGYTFAYAEVYRYNQTVATPTGGLALANVAYLPTQIAA